jgi:hypothetical protein
LCQSGSEPSMPIAANGYPAAVERRMGLKQFLLGALGAITAWLITEFLARPFRQFFDLRREIARRMVEYANVRARAQMAVHAVQPEPVDLSEAGEKRLAEAEKTFRDLAAQMQGFAVGEWVAAKAVKKAVGFDAMEISRALIGFANEIGTYGKGRHDYRERINKLLRLGEE